MDAAEIAKSLVGPTGTYHAHKEQLAHLSAAAYIGAAAAFAFSKPTHIPGAVALLVILTAILGLLYVAWQLERRDEAAREVKGYYEILFNALPTAERSVFTALADPQANTSLPKVLVLVSMVLWAAAAVVVAFQRYGIGAA